MVTCELNERDPSLCNARIISLEFLGYSIFKVVSTFLQEIIFRGLREKSVQFFSFPRWRKLHQTVKNRVQRKLKPFSWQQRILDVTQTFPIILEREREVT